MPFAIAPKIGLSQAGRLSVNSTSFSKDSGEIAMFGPAPSLGHVTVALQRIINFMHKSVVYDLRRFELGKQLKTVPDF